MPAILVSRNDNESNDHLVRRFVRKVQSSGKLKQAKRGQFKEAVPSRRLRRREAVRRKNIREEREYLRKIGQLEEFPTRSKRR